MDAETAEKQLRDRVNPRNFETNWKLREMAYPESWWWFERAELVLTELARLRGELVSVKEVLQAELDGAADIRKRLGAKERETFPGFVERLAAESKAHSVTEAELARLRETSALAIAVADADVALRVHQLTHGAVWSGHPEHDERLRLMRAHEKALGAYRRSKP